MSGKIVYILEIYPIKKLKMTKLEKLQNLYFKAFQNEANELLEKCFPKRRCKERGQALVFNAHLIISFKKKLKQFINDLEQLQQNE